MAVQVRCPNCGKGGSAPDRVSGHAVRCPHCRHKFTIAPTSDGSCQATLDPDRPTQPDPPPSPAGAAPPRVGRFEVRGLLGKGAFGAVYRAYDPQLDREVALKVPRPGALDSPRAAERFLREARAAAGLRHPHIVPVYDAGHGADGSYIAAAFVEGRTLAHAVADGPLEAKHAAGIARGLAEALAYAHRSGIVHRDVKPANVLLDAAGEPHLTDFGLATSADESEKLTRDGALMGTPSYMAPEQAAGQQGAARPAADQYGLGVVLYEMLAGRPPFEGPAPALLYHAVHTEPPPPRTFRAEVSPDLETVCLKAMAKRPEDRYADCQELADDLRRCLEGEPVKARPLTPRERLARWLRKNPGLARAAGVTAACLALLALVGGLGSVGMAALARHEEEARQHAESAREAEAEAQEKAVESRRAAARAKEEIERDNQQAAAALAGAQESSHKAQESQRKAEEQRREEDQLLAAAREAERTAAEALAKAEEAGQAREGERRKEQELLKAEAVARFRAMREPHTVKTVLAGTSFNLLSPDGTALVNVIVRTEGKGLTRSTYPCLCLHPLGPRQESSPRTPEPLRLVGETRPLWVVFDRDGKSVMAAWREKLVVYDVATWREVRTISLEHLAVADVITPHPDFRHVAVRNAADQTVVLWNIEGEPRKVATIKPEGTIFREYGLTFSGDGKYLALQVFAFRNHRLEVREALGGKLVSTIPLDASGLFRPPIFSPDGEQVLIAQRALSLSLYASGTGKRMRDHLVLQGQQPFAVSPDARFIVTGAWERENVYTVRILDAATGECVHKLPVTGSVSSLALVDEGKRLVALTDDGVAYTWTPAPKGR